MNETSPAWEKQPSEPGATTSDSAITSYSKVRNGPWRKPGGSRERPKKAG